MDRTLRILHLIDETLRWDERLAVEQLLERLDGKRFDQSMVALGPLRGEAARIERSCQRVPCRFNLPLSVAPRLRNLIEKQRTDLVHAWSGRAIAVASLAADTGVATVASMSDPALADECARRLRAGRGDRGTAVVTATELVRRRLIERGLSPGDAVLIRPGVDFGALNRVRGSDLRERLGLEPEHLVLLTDQPAGRQGGHFSAFWAAAVRSFLDPRVRLIVPGRSRETARLRRLARAVGKTDVLGLPDEEFRTRNSEFLTHRQEHLLAVADCLLLPATAEAPVTAAAWAMAAGAPIIASATRAVAELLAHEHNALLIKPDAPKRLAMRFADTLGRNDWAKRTEVARAQAYRVFGLRRYVDQVGQVYQNVIDGRPASDGIADPAAA